jgi:hypothetical protein
VVDGGGNLGGRRGKQGREERVAARSRRELGAERAREADWQGLARFEINEQRIALAGVRLRERDVERLLRGAPVAPGAREFPRLLAAHEGRALRRRHR